MPILKYFLWVGGGLLALMLVVDFYLPRQPQRTEAYHSYNIPIAAAVHVGPGAITFSGETRNFGAPPPMTVVDFSAQPNGQTQAMQAHAQMTGTPPSAEQAAKPARKKVAKRKIHQQDDFGDRDLAHLPNGWQRDRHTGLAFAPFFW